VTAPAGGDDTKAPRGSTGPAAAGLGGLLERAGALPPRQLLARAAARAGRLVRRRWRRVRDRLLGTAVSDRQLRAALRPDLRGAGRLPAFLRSPGAPAFLAPDDLEAAAAALERHCPGAVARTVAAADRARGHVFDLLGSGPVPLGAAIDWHADFKSGHRYDPRAHATLVAPAAPPGGHDIKVPWELSRGQHLAWLAQAWRLTGDERYAREVAGQVTAWIEANPRGFGVNWACAMDVAIRAVNWLWAVRALAGSPALDDEFLLRLEKSLLAHGRHVRAHLEREGRVTHNHYLADLAGLATLGLLCPELREAGRWRDLALRELWRETLKQVHADGSDFEASVSYHRLVTELVLVPVLLCRARGIAVPGAVTARLERMLEYVLHYTRPDGGAPLVGDCDDGRLLRLVAWDGDEREWSDHRHLLAAGAVLFAREDLGRAAGDRWEEAFWLLGGEAVRFKEALDARGAAAAEPGARRFPDGGLCVLRGGGAYVAVDAGGVGQGGNGGHAHADALGFEYAADGGPWVVDPGSGVYTADYATRNRFRSSRAHAVLVVDGAETDRFDERELFAMRDDARPVVERWEPAAGGDRLVARHHGYERLDPPVSVRRAFRLDHASGALLVTDEAEGEGRHAFSLRLPLPAGALVEVAGSVARVRRPDGGRLSVCVAPGGGEAALAAADGLFSPGYGIVRPAPALDVAGTFAGRLRLAVLLVPERGGRERPADELAALAARLAEDARPAAGTGAP
jgi:hypothetical protein